MVKKHLWFLLTLVLFGLFAMKTFWGPEYFDGHDAQNHILRLYQYDIALKDGQIPPQWAGGLLAGRGYPVFIFAYQLPYALAQAFHLLGASLAVAIKLTFVASYLLSLIFMYLFASQYWQSGWAGFISAFLWSWAPPIFEKIFIAGALGEIVSLAFIPLTFLTLFNLIKKPNIKNSILLSFSLTLWSLSHLLTPIIFSPLIIIFALFQLSRTKKVSLALNYLIISGLITCGLTAWFFAPLLAELKFTHFNHFIQSKYQEQFVSLRRLLYSKWVTDAPGWGDNPVSQQVGVAQWLAVALAGLAWLKTRKTSILPFLLTFALSLFLMLSISRPVWALPTPLKYIGTPWRFLSLSVFTAAVAAGFVIKSMSRSGLRFLILTVLLFLTLYGNRNHLRLNQRVNYDKKFFDNYKGVATGWNEHMPVWMAKPPKQFADRLEIVSGSCQITDLIEKSNLTSFTADCQASSVLQINTAYYPRWQVSIDGQNITDQIKANLSQSNGVMRFPISVGIHQVQAQFQNTALNRATRYLSVLVLTAVSILIIFYNKRRFFPQP